MPSVIYLILVPICLNGKWKSESAYPARLKSPKQGNSFESMMLSLNDTLFGIAVIDYRCIFYKKNYHC